MLQQEGTDIYNVLCRLCSSDDGIRIVNIFENEGKRRRISSLIQACLPVEVSEGDPLPKLICHRCLHKLEMFDEFRESCALAQERLKSYFASVEAIPAIGSKKRRNSESELEIVECVKRRPHRVKRTELRSKVPAEVIDSRPEPVQGTSVQSEVPSIPNAETEIIQIPNTNTQIVKLPIQRETEILPVQCAASDVHSPSENVSADNVIDRTETNNAVQDSFPSTSSAPVRTSEVSIFPVKSQEIEQVNVKQEIIETYQESDAQESASQRLRRRWLRSNNEFQQRGVTDGGGLQDCQLRDRTRQTFAHVPKSANDNWQEHGLISFPCDPHFTSQTYSQPYKSTSHDVIDYRKTPIVLIDSKLRNQTSIQPCKDTSHDTIELGGKVGIRNTKQKLMKSLENSSNDLKEQCKKLIKESKAPGQLKSTNSDFRTCDENLPLQQQRVTRRKSADQLESTSKEPHEKLVVHKTKTRRLKSPEPLQSTNNDLEEPVSCDVRITRSKSTPPPEITNVDLKKYVEISVSRKSRRKSTSLECTNEYDGKEGSPDIEVKRGKFKHTFESISYELKQLAESFPDITIRKSTGSNISDKTDCSENVVSANTGVTKEKLTQPPESMISDARRPQATVASEKPIAEFKKQHKRTSGGLKESNKKLPSSDLKITKIKSTQPSKSVQGNVIDLKLMDQNPIQPASTINDELEHRNETSCLSCQTTKEDVRQPQVTSTEKPIPKSTQPDKESNKELPSSGLKITNIKSTQQTKSVDDLKGNFHDLKLMYQKPTEPANTIQEEENKKVSRKVSDSKSGTSRTLRPRIPGVSSPYVYLEDETDNRDQPTDSAKRKARNPKQISGDTQSNKRSKATQRKPASRGVHRNTIMQAQKFTGEENAPSKEKVEVIPDTKELKIQPKVEESDDDDYKDDGHLSEGEVVENEPPTDPDEKQVKCAWCSKMFWGADNLLKHLKHCGTSRAEALKKKILKEPEISLPTTSSASETESQCLITTNPPEFDLVLAPGKLSYDLCEISSFLNLSRDEEEKPYICVVCKKGFKNRYTLKKHSTIHG